MTKLSDIITSFVKGVTKRAPNFPLERNVSEESGTPDTETESPKLINDEPPLGQTIPKIKKYDIPVINIGNDKSPTPIPKESTEEVEITGEFEEAFKLVDSRAPFIFVTGRAGTGKSTFVRLLKSRLKSFALVAPTGVAALNVGGQTIHSFFRIPPGPIDFSKIQRVRNRIAYQALRAVIIDEISMVRADLLDAVDLMLRKNASSPDKPFGGVQIIAVGDLFQLPPVVATEEEQAFLSRGYESPFFFSANSLKEIELRCIEFSRVFRQTEESFIQLLNSIREGKNLDHALTSINHRLQPLAEHEFDGIVLTGTNAAASRQNDTKLREIQDPMTLYNGEISGEFKIDKNKLPAPLELSLKKGARVMFVKNDRLKRWVNGTIGTVVECEANSVLVSLYDPFCKREVRVEPESWENLKYDYNADVNAVVATKIGSYKQIPLTLAWAVTIHKSQGKTFDRIHIDLESGAFAEGQVYVALSRCRTLEGVTLQRPIRKEDIYLNYDVISFCARTLQK